MDVFGSFDFLHDVMLLDLLTVGHDMMPKYLSNLMYNQSISDDDNDDDDDDDRVDIEMGVPTKFVQSFIVSHWNHVG